MVRRYRQIEMIAETILLLLLLGQMLVIVEQGLECVLLAARFRLRRVRPAGLDVDAGERNGSIFERNCQQETDDFTPIIDLCIQLSLSIASRGIIFHAMPRWEVLGLERN